MDGPVKTQLSSISPEKTEQSSKIADLIRDTTAGMKLEKIASYKAAQVCQLSPAHILREGVRELRV